MIGTIFRFVDCGIALGLVAMAMVVVETMSSGGKADQLG